jgi:hypothetical protein
MNALVGGSMESAGATSLSGHLERQGRRRLERGVGVSRRDPERRVNNDLRAVADCPVFNRPHRDQPVRSHDGKLTGQPRCDRSMSHALGEVP